MKWNEMNVNFKLFLNPTIKEKTTTKETKETNNLHIKKKNI